MSWQPIETAPKDGTEVLLYFSDGRILIGDYVVTEQLRHGKTAWKNEGWRTFFGLVHDNKPTHWMPLPEPPL